MDIQRRDFIKLLGGSTIATALPGCTRRRPRNLIPYIIPHEEIRPGKAVWYASVCRECPAGCGIHVRVREGRAVKVEGNPVHPVNQGKLCSRGHASLQGLYNPDRIQQPLRRTEEGRWQRLSWDDAEELIADRIRTARNASAGSSVAMIGSHQTGSLDRLIGDFLSVIGSDRRLRYEPFGFESLRVASRTVYGLDKVPRYSIAGARYIASFGSDFLETWMSPVRHAREFGATREVMDNRMVPFLHVGPRLSMTATNADEFIQVKPGHEYAIALGMVHVIVHENLARNVPRAQINQIRAVVEDHFPREVEKLTGIPHRKIEQLARKFAGAEPGAAIAGTPMLDGSNGAMTASAVHLLNFVCGNVGRTVFFDEGDRYERVSSYTEIHRFIRSMEQGEVSVLFIHDTNPSFTMPRVSGFNAALQKIPLTVALSSFMDETASRADIILPVHTPLESWGDYEPEDGVYGLMQPSMRPVFNTRMAGDVLLSLRQKILGADERLAYHEYVREQWQAHHRRFAPNADFEEFWIESLANGGRFTDARPVQVSLNPRLAKQNLIELNERAESESERSGFELMTYPSLNHYDGRGANRPWLQEIPDPMTQMTWENWAEIHPDDAGRIGVRTGDKIELRSRHGYIELPAYVYEGVQRGVIAVPVGQGHTEYGRYAENNGANPIALLPPRPSDATGSMVWSGIPVTVVNKQERLRIANAAGSDYQHGRPFLQVVTVEELVRNSAKKEKEVPQIYDAHEHPDHRWGMTIDLNKCIGCSACVTACYAENNIPVVGKEDVRRGRELSWLQVQRFFDAREDASNGRFLPMLCQHCDNAPCEPVCPVFAAYHTPEGLNAQVYNRCIGTRYCANNCPYKVRRFNWWDYDFPSPLNWQLNPDVTVRSKGVMEKCTFCVQRITGARQQARLEGREIRDGDVVTACQQSCPTDAIVFGDLKDPDSRVNRMRDRNRPRGYRVLEELNTQPAVVYLKDVVERTA